MGKLSKYRGASKKFQRTPSLVKANMLVRIVAYIIDLILIRVLFRIILLPFNMRGLISEEFMTDIRIYLGEGLAPFRGGGLLIEHFIFINSLNDVIIHLSYSALFLAYFILLESNILGGQTLGKKIFGLQSVNKFGSITSLKESTLRNSTKYLYRVPLVCFLMGFLEMVLMFFYQTRSGDMIIGSKVVSRSKKGLSKRMFGYDK